MSITNLQYRVELHDHFFQGDLHTLNKAERLARQTLRLSANTMKFHSFYQQLLGEERIVDRVDEPDSIEEFCSQGFLICLSIINIYNVPAELICHEQYFDIATSFRRLVRLSGLIAGIADGVVENHHLEDKPMLIEAVLVTASLYLTIVKAHHPERDFEYMIHKTFQRLLVREAKNLFAPRIQAAITGMMNDGGFKSPFTS